MAKQDISTSVPRLRLAEFRNEQGWALWGLGELVEFSSGGTPSKGEPSYWGGDIPWISASSMYEANIADSELKVTSLAIGNGTRFASKGSLLVLVRGSMLFNRVPMGIAVVDVAFNQDVKALKIGLGINARFLLNQLIAISPRIPINETGIGAGKIETDTLVNLPVYLPSEGEQKKIADCLTSLDEVIAAQGRKVEALKAHKRGLMQQLFPREGETRPRLRFPEFRDAPEWELGTLGCVCEVMNNRRVPISSGDRRPGPFPYYGASGVVDFVDHFIFDERLLLVGEDGAKWGAFEETAFIADGKYWVNNHAHVLKPVQVIETLLASYLTMIDLARYVTGHAPPKLTLAKLKSIAVVYPESLSEQRRIADCLSSLDSQITAESHQLATLKTHKQGLMQQLFPDTSEKLEVRNEK